MPIVRTLNSASKKVLLSGGGGGGGSATFGGLKPDNTNNITFDQAYGFPAVDQQLTIDLTDAPSDQEVMATIEHLVSDPNFVFEVPANCNVKGTYIPEELNIITILYTPNKEMLQMVIYQPENNEVPDATNVAPSQDYGTVSVTADAVTDESGSLFYAQVNQSSPTDILLNSTTNEVVLTAYVGNTFRVGKRTGKSIGGKIVYSGTIVWSSWQTVVSAPTIIRLHAETDGININTDFVQQFEEVEEFRGVDGNLDVGNPNVIVLQSIGDSFELDFSLPSAKGYIVKMKCRSGTNTAPSTYFTSGHYKVYYDDSGSWVEIPMEDSGDALQEIVSSPASFGWFGVLRSTSSVTLPAGTQRLKIEMGSGSFGIVDYVTVE
ncbi:MAG: hypothetical protein F6K19_01720 [Cyanothece sp. SIO1E1]|nr:hypothetical protein [Cyanothece sp. SIO1E1]